MKRLKDRRMTIRLSETEAAQVQAQARACGVTVSEWIRAAALKKQVTSVADMEVLNELRRQGGLLKHLYNAGTLNPETSLSILIKLGDIAARLIKKE